MCIKYEFQNHQKCLDFVLVVVPVLERHFRLLINIRNDLIDLVLESNPSPTTNVQVQVNVLVGNPADATPNFLEKPWHIGIAAGEHRGGHNILPMITFRATVDDSLYFLLACLDAKFTTTTATVSWFEHFGFKEGLTSGRVLEDRRRHRVVLVNVIHHRCSGHKPKVRQIRSFIELYIFLLLNSI